MSLSASESVEAIEALARGLARAGVEGVEALGSWRGGSQAGAWRDIRASSPLWRALRGSRRSGYGVGGNGAGR